MSEENSFTAKEVTHMRVDNENSIFSFLVMQSLVDADMVKEVVDSGNFDPEDLNITIEVCGVKFPSSKRFQENLEKHFNEEVERVANERMQNNLNKIDKYTERFKQFILSECGVENTDEG